VTKTKAVSIGFDSHAVHHAIGLMSGTSHDGVSAALVRIARDGKIALLAFRTFPYGRSLRARLLAAVTSPRTSAGEISALHFGLGRAFGNAALKVARAARFPIERVSFVGSHGHTFFHLPPRRARHGEIASTLQLGESAVIAAITDLPVVADFRPMDLALGGEAAPLAPLAHLRLFGDQRLSRVVQNIGGVGNATYLPAAAIHGDPRVVAFDTGPGNMLIDALAAKLSRGRLMMDRDGRFAASGRVNQTMLRELIRLRYFKRKPPKSTGREEFGAQMLAQIESRARAMRIAPRDLIATLTALTARSIGDAIRRFIMPLGPVDQVVVTGGGGKNPTLLAMLKAELQPMNVIRAEDLSVSGEALEAIAFVILAYEFLCLRPGNLPSATGARAPAILGKLTLPP
jgi:anhydro-N-acetylmuramic acid kinase